MTEHAYAAPTPRVFYIHDDLSAYVRQKHGEDSVAFRLTQELLALMRWPAPQVVVLQLEDQVLRLVAQGDHAPFALAIGIGQAGERVAQLLHARTGWFPTVRRVDVTRQEDGRGSYTVVSTTPTPLAEQLHGLTTCTSLAVVDDTVFSGITMRTLLSALPPDLLPRTHAFCLRGVAESLPSLRALCPLSIGFAAPGRILEDVSFINATGLVLRIAIRRPGQPAMAFFERPDWLQAWFPGRADAVLALCQRLNALLEPLGPGESVKREA
jgi:hypothetical protein